MSTTEPYIPLILIVDDNRGIRELMNYGLKREYRVVEAESGVEALEKLKDGKPDLVITDLMMPEMDGMELLKRLRENPELKNLPVIFLSAKTGIDTQVSALEAGAEVFVTKPFKMELLKAQVKSLLNFKQRG